MYIAVWHLHWLVLLFYLASLRLSWGMTDSGEDLQLLVPSVGDDLRYSRDDDGSLPQQFCSELDHHDLFGSPGYEFNFETRDDRSLMSGEHGPDDVAGLAEAPPQVTAPTRAREQHDAIFARCLLSNCEVSGLKMPWEVGIFREIFSDEPAPQQLVPAMEISADCPFNFGVEPQIVAERVAETANCSSAHPIFASCVSCTDGKIYAERRADLKSAAVSKLIVVLKHHLPASVTGRHILDLGEESMQSEGAKGIVEAVVGVRSPATLIKRANSLLSFLRWVAHAHDGTTDPFNEALLWRYFTFLKESGAPATKADSTLSAMRFAHFVLGFEGLAAAVASRRLVGLSEIMLSGKRLLKQAAVLTVSQVLGLHAALKNQNLHVMDRAAVAYILFCLYGRCRNSDLQAIHSIEMDFSSDGGFVTLDTCFHKTGRMASLKTRLLPILIPARGVNGEVWVSDALQAFSEAGVRLENPIDGPLLPAPAGEAGAFLGRSLMSNEVSALLRNFLGIPNGGQGDETPLVSSHSLKATTLAWAARYGLSPSTRSLLGRHSSCLNETFAVYSRDLMVSPVVELQHVIDAIANKEFSPDEQRSRFFGQATGSAPQDNPANLDAGQCVDVESVKSLATSAGDDGAHVVNLDDSNETPAEPNVTPMEEVGTDDSSSDEEKQLSSSESDMPDLPPPRVKRFRARIPVDEKWYVHSKSRLVHRFEGGHEGPQILVCGKRLTKAYEPCTEATAWNVLCRSCNRR